MFELKNKIFINSPSSYSNIIHMGAWIKSKENYVKSKKKLEVKFTRNMESDGRKT